MKKLRVIVANDHTLVSAAIRTFLETKQGMEVLASVRIGPEARKVVRQKKPELLFLYLGVRGFEGLEKAEGLLKSFPRLPNVLLAVNNSREYVARAFQAGVDAILPQTAKAGELEKAVRAAMRGGSYISPILPKPEATSTAFDKLTPRQRSVLTLMAEGKSTKGIAKALGLSPKTVEFHRARLMERLDIYNVPGLVRLAARVGLVSIEC
jgi:DNA-binding NarL/FixJ family response regulator